MEKKISPCYAQVVMDLPINQVFTYGIPNELKTKIQKGMPVIIPFGPRKTTGYVVGFISEIDPGLKAKIKKIIALSDPQIFLDKKLFSLTEQVRDYYYAPWGEVIAAVFPPKIRKNIYTETGQTEWPAPTRFISPYRLTPAQQSAGEKILAGVDQEKFSAFLLHGVTGSGKTEVYLQIVSKIIDKKKGAIILVPEIFLTPGIFNEFKTRFGARTALLHSRLSPAFRAAEWRRVYAGQADIVLGTRLAVFAPVKNLGIIIVDEEHDSSYKQDEGVKYNARDVAVMRAKIEQAIVVLGSATPSLESYNKVTQKEYTCISLPERVEESCLPEIKIVDLKQNLKGGLISLQLKEAIYKRLEKKEQVILFLNRRGSARFLQCPQCGHTPNCINCSVSLVFHADTKSLQCHYCDYKAPLFIRCPACKSSKINYLGMGTQKLEIIVRKLFPRAKVARMDKDTMKKKGAFEEMFRSFKNREIDLLIGTQILAKGHDFPFLTLVGVIYADASLNFPDFRAAERTFQLLTQVSGRAGRRKEKGEVIIQTYNPDHFTILSTRNHNYQEFYQKELAIRLELNLPPFTKIINLIIETNEEKKGEIVCGQLKNIFDSMSKADTGIEILGPAPANLYKKRNKYRWQIILKGSAGKDEAVHSFLSRGLAQFSSLSPDKQIRIMINADPLSFD